MTLAKEYDASIETKTTLSRPLEIDALTSLRAIAAFWVFMHHFAGVSYNQVIEHVWQAIIVEGHIGVTIFFVLSGFLFTLRYYDDAIANRFNLYNYFTKRIARIYPLYFFILLVTLFYNVIPIFSTDTLVNWTLTQGFFSNLKFTGVSTAWSLTTEESFYLLLPIVYFTVRKFWPRDSQSPRKEIIKLTTILVIWSVVMAILGLELMRLSSTLHLDEPGGFMSNLPSLTYTTIFFRFSQFAVGIFCARFYHLFLAKSDYYKPISRILLFVSIAGILMSAFMMRMWGGVYQAGWIFNFPAAIFAGLFIIALCCKSLWISRILSWRPFVYLGKISYALYLVQGSVMIGPLNVLPFTPIAIAAKYVGMNLISAFLYESVEKPGSGFIKRNSQQIKQWVLEKKLSRNKKI